MIPCNRTTARALLVCLLVLCLGPGGLHAIGIKLKSGEYFVAELLEDRIDAFEVRFAGRRYRIPVDAIQKVEMEKTAPDTVLDLTLEDGSRIRGVLLGVEGETLRLRTAAGEARLQLAQIDRREEGPEPMQAPPEDFLMGRQNQDGVSSASGYGSLGLFLYGGGVFGELSDTHQTAGGAGIVWEPYFASFAPGGLGVRMDYLALPNRLPIEIGSAFLTLYFYFPSYSFYFDFGGGGSIIRYIRSRTAETSPSATLGFGWRSQGGESFYFKAGVRGQYMQSRFGGMGHAGLEFAGVFKL